jgi:hypothetical protein
MKSVTRPKTAASAPMEERFQRFATALMAVPKKELDKETAKSKREKRLRNQKKKGVNGKMR